MASLPEPKIVKITVRDGTEIAVALYMPENAGQARFPVLFAAAPYRFDNNTLPTSPQFLWRETGPIEFYVARGYVYAHMDARGCGRSGGDFDLLGPKDQADLYDVIEWLGAQTWSTGRVGGIGQSYFTMLQWFMGIANPPALACLGAHDGLNDAYRAGAYHGGIRCDFLPGYWWHQNRIINAHPANGAEPRTQDVDLDLMISAHPNLDDFWRARSAFDRLHEIKVPLYSSGVWVKHQLHTRGNIEGFRRASGPRKLRLSGAPNAWATAAEFASVDFHRDVMLPFYDHYLKGEATSYTDRAPVEYVVRGSGVMRTAQQWPPEGVEYRALHLGTGPTGSVTSLNDGCLSPATPGGAAETSYAYPQPGWVNGTIGFGAGGPASGFDPARRVLTFTTAPLAGDVEICGPIKLVLHLSSTARDTDVLVKLSDQAPMPAEAREAGANPPAEIVTRGWLRAAHRALDPVLSTEMEPVHAHEVDEPLAPGQVYRLEISLEPMAYLFRAGHRIRLEIANGDSAVTEVFWGHFYRPDKIGRDTVHHSATHQSQLFLPVTHGAEALD